jgi:hypothetical protein
MADDGAIQLWHQGIHWSLKREGDQYWCKEKEGERTHGVEAGIAA